MYQNPNGADEIQELTIRYKEVEKTLEAQQLRNTQLEEKLKTERSLREQENADLREERLRSDEMERQLETQHTKITEISAKNALLNNLVQ